MKNTVNRMTFVNKVLEQNIDTLSNLDENLVLPEQVAKLIS